MLPHKLRRTLDPSARRSPLRPGRCLREGAAGPLSPMSAGCSRSPASAGWPRSPASAGSPARAWLLAGLIGLLSISLSPWVHPPVRAQEVDPGSADPAFDGLDAAPFALDTDEARLDSEAEAGIDLASGTGSSSDVGSDSASGVLSESAAAFESDPRAEMEPDPAAEAADPFYTAQRPPGWTYRLRLWNTLGRLYALRGLPPPLPADLRNASGGSIGAEPPALAERDSLDVLLLGSDLREGDGPWRTDTILLASLDRQTGRIGLVSIPRDLWVSIPGYGSGRINTADWLGSSRGLPDGQLIRDTIALNLGLEVDHFVRIDLRGFVAVVDALGGLEVVADCPMEDFFYDPESLGGEQAIDLATGRHLMDGETALRFARSRWRTSDFDRSRRQQRVLRAALGKAREAGFVRRAPALWKSLAPWLSTDIDAGDIPGLALLGLRFADRMQLRSAVLGHPATIDWTTPDGSQVLLINPGAAADILNQVLAAPEAEDAALAASRSITIFDATGQAAWEPVMATRLEEAGFKIQLESRPAGPQSMLFFAPAAEAAAGEVIRALGLPESVLRPDEAWPGERPATTPLWVHLGGDWEPCGRR